MCHKHICFWSFQTSLVLLVYKTWCRFLRSITKCHQVPRPNTVWLPSKQKMWKVNHWQKPLVGSQIGLCWMVAVATGEDALLCNLGTSSLLTQMPSPLHAPASMMRCTNMSHATSIIFHNIHCRWLTKWVKCPSEDKLWQILEICINF